MENGELNRDLNVGDKRAASDMLEDALQHFDHIIDGSNYENNMYNSDNEDSSTNNLDFDSGLHGVAMLMEDLRNAVETTVEAETGDQEDKSFFSDALLKHISPETLEFYRKLLQLKVNKNETESEKVKRLQNENEMLTLHVSVLTDQVELQTDKLNEIEEKLNEANTRLEGADSRLQEEVAAKTSLETEKLKLMNEMSNYKLELVQKEQQKKLENDDLADMERKKSESESRNDQYKERILNLEKLLVEKDSKIQELEKKIIETEKATVVPKLMSPDEGIVHDHIEKQDPTMLQLRMPVPYATSTPISNEQLPTKNNQSKSEDKQNNQDQVDGSKELTSTVSRVNKIPPFPVRAQSLEKLQALKIIQSEPKTEDEDLNRSGSTDILSTSTNPQSWTPTSTKSPKSSSTPNLAMTEIKPLNYQEEPNRETPTSTVSPFHQRKKHGFRKFFTSFRLRRSRSSQIESETDSQPQPTSTAPLDDNREPSMFVRGGVRSTAGPRLQWNPNDASGKFGVTQNDDTPFCRWDCDRICQWLIDIGLPAYVENCKKWVRNGDTLLRATSHELEKELGIRHPLHKKKLMLHLGAVGEKGEEWEEGADRMNSVWVARWLDDIGLPQYKDSFHEACIDGRTLHHLTVSDAHKLKVTNLVHLLSLRRALQVLRTCKFDPTLLQRRPIEEGDKDDVSLWTNHRVMEWLRSIDLAEYASNLRGSGVHGALLGMEPLFTADTLASLLHMPLNKSLLRRHLAAKMEELLPSEFVKIKNEKMQESGHHPLNVNVKYKIGRRSFGGLVRFRGASAASSVREFGSGEYVCPMSSSAKSMARHRDELETKMQMQGLKEKRIQDTAEGASNQNSNNDNIEVVELNESTTREINAFSNQINSLTNNWSQN